jgi:hypothetical protein
MKPLKYAIYPPAETNVPWLAVVLDDDRPVDMFSCADRNAAERVLFEMKARNDAKNGAAYA